MLERVGELVIVERFQYQGLLRRPLDLPTLAVPSELWTHTRLAFGSAPIGDLVGLAIPGSQCRTFLFLKDLQRLPSGGAMDPLSGDIPTPAGRLIPEVGQVPELPALQEALPHVLDAPLDVGLVPGVTHPCRIGDEAPVL